MTDNIDAKDNILFRKHIGLPTQDIKVKEEELFVKPTYKVCKVGA